MKKKSLIGIGLALFMFFCLPFNTRAKEAVTIYLFRGEGCPHCQEAEEFFKKLSEDTTYADKFVVKDFEVWKSKKNNELMEKVADKMDDTLNGVPYIVIGDKTWGGYTSTYDDAIKTQILKIYNDDNYEDTLASLVAEYENKKSNSWITIAIIIGSVVIIGSVLHFARQGVEEPQEEKEKKNEVKEEPKKEIKDTEEKTKEKEETKKKNSNNKKSTKKKTTSKGKNKKA